MSARHELRFHLVDVFTHEQFGGNPLAVVPDADTVDETTMGQIARELNQSETTFLLRPPTRAEPIGSSGLLPRPESRCSEPATMPWVHGGGSQSLACSVWSMSVHISVS
jgi:hypothetical protein